MPKCKWCGEKFDRDDLTARGYCEECDKKLRDDILTNKKKLENLKDISSSTLSDAEKQEIVAEAEKTYKTLREYKDKKVAFFKSDIEGLYKSIYAKLGISLPKNSISYKRLSKNYIIAFSASVIILTMLVFAIPSILTSLSSMDETKITLSEFNQIQNGMTYDEVIEIIGSPGELLSDVDIGLGQQYATKIYMWEGAGDYGSNANISFQGGRVILKAQIGLR